jgi:hypothetical protein
MLLHLTKILDERTLVEMLGIKAWKNGWHYRRINR